MRGVTTVYVNGIGQRDYGCPLYHYMFGWRAAMRDFDPLFDLW